MNPRVVVLGAGYAGAGAVVSLEAELGGAVDLTWVSEDDHHVVLHEAHRAIREPRVRDSVAIPVEEIKAPETTFHEGTVTGLDTAARTVHLADGSALDYDYVVVAIGSGTAYYGIPGLETHAHTLKSLDDALGIHDAVRTAAAEATDRDPAQVVVGGAGLSGIQAAGEVAEFRDDEFAPIEVTLVEALPEIFPPGGEAITRLLRRKLEAADVDILTDDPITEAGATRLHFEERAPLEYDVLVWTGGITGRDVTAEAGVEAEHGRLVADDTFQTSDERVFALGDAAMVAQGQGEEPAPPTAQAAWDAAKLVGRNVRHTIADEPLESWAYEGLGTLVSVGEASIAADIPFVPVAAFNSLPATVLKRGAAARWIASITSWHRALRSWDDL